MCTRAQSETSSTGHSHTTTYGMSTILPEHSCTHECYRLHLVEKLRVFEIEIKKLATTLPVNDFIWYRSQIEDLFDQALLGGLR